MKKKVNATDSDVNNANLNEESDYGDDDPKITKINNKKVNKENKKTVKKPINNFKKVVFNTKNENESKKKLEKKVLIIQRFWKK